MAKLAPIAAHHGLLLSVLQQMRAASSRGVVVAVTSSNSGEGVTHSVISLTESLQRDSTSRTLQIDARHLRSLAVEPADVPSLCVPTRMDGVFTLDLAAAHSAHSPAGTWEGNLQYRRDCVQALRGYFDYILIDCPALQAAGDALNLAPVSDGVLMVVEAETTRKDQILRAEKSIEFAGGKVIGNILNKRAYVVPEWVYRRL